jgi:hypothetical protein
VREQNYWTHTGHTQYLYIIYRVSVSIDYPIQHFQVVESLSPERVKTTHPISFVFCFANSNSLRSTKKKKSQLYFPVSQYIRHISTFLYIKTLISNILLEDEANQS